MDPNPVNQLFGVSSNFRSTELSSLNQVNMRLTIFLGARLPLIILIIVINIVDIVDIVVIVRQWNVSALLHISFVAQN